MACLENLELNAGPIQVEHISSTINGFAPVLIWCELWEPWDSSGAKSQYLILETQHISYHIYNNKR